MSDYAPGVSPDDIIKITFVVMQNGKPVSKEVSMKRGKFIDCNARGQTKGFTKAAQLYELIVAEKAYEKITDLDNVN
ncbi:hypothetical protein [Spirosoma foliorum]|uniref:Uncharacterized protein n=1 Tax=Spirosoma foliorum TaxID=2710596 RepID=A0A7G5H5E3_9BACT|nr:hypothetical protein [Spirosoma foliorum]QMW06335.1 hypothetical protein H3H32_16315 [Spirosoma foliorum]